MGIGNFYKQPKPRKFRYVYRFYDPKKEAEEKRRRRVRRQYGLDDDVTPDEIKEGIKGSIRKQSEHLSKYDKGMLSKQSFAERNRTSIIILILGVVLLMWLFRNLGTGLFRYIGQGFSNIFSLFG